MNQFSTKRRTDRQAAKCSRSVWTGPRWTLPSPRDSTTLTHSYRCAARMRNVPGHMGIVVAQVVFRVLFKETVIVKG